MTKLFIAILFLFLDYNISFGSGMIGILPDFVGYAFLLAGIKELSDYSVRFTDIRLYAKIFMGVSAIIYVADLLGFTTPLGFYGLLILRILITGAALFVSYLLIFALNDVEIKSRKRMNSKQLMTSWKITALFFVAAYAIVLFPEGGGFAPIFMLIAGVYFSTSFYQVCRKYRG